MLKYILHWQVTGKLTHVELPDETGEVVMFEVSGQQFHGERRLVANYKTQTVLRNVEQH